MNTPQIYLAALLGLALTAATLSGAQPEKSAPSAKKEKSVHFDKPQAPATLPGKGLAQHDFILMGVRSSSDGKGIRMADDRRTEVARMPFPDNPKKLRAA